MNAIVRNRTQYMPKTSEHNEQVAFFVWAAYTEKRFPVLKWLFAIPNGGFRHIATACRLKAEGVKKGVFDIMLPVARGGYHGLFIEMKANKNKLTPEQVEFQQFITEQNYKQAVCYSMEEAKYEILNYLVSDRFEKMQQMSKTYAVTTGERKNYEKIFGKD